MTRRREGGAILLFVLMALAILAVTGAVFAQAAASRLAAAMVYREAMRAAFARQAAGGGQLQRSHATMADGADGASSNEALHGSQAIPSGRDDRVGPGPH